MDATGEESSQGRFTRTEDLFAPSAFDLKLQIDGELLEWQNALPEALFGDLTDIEYSDESTFPKALFGDLTDIEYSDESDSGEAKKGADGWSGGVGNGLDLPGTARKRPDYVELAKERFRLYGDDWDKARGKRRMINMVRGRARRRDQESKGFREGPSLKKMKGAGRIRSSVAAKDLPRSSSGWQGTPGSPASSQRLANFRGHPTLEELTKDEGMELVEWNGIDPKVIRDAQGNAIVILVGRPNREGYLKSCKDAHGRLLAGAQKLYPGPRGCETHRRGCFPNPGGGFGMGGGSEAPNPVKFKSKRVQKWWFETFESEPVQEVVGFTRCCMEAVCQGDLRASDAVLDQICNRDPRLQRLKGSAFASATFNVGPQVWTKRHRDFMNRACWFCSVTAFGDYDYAKEGHLVLWELRMVVQFPPGSTIFLPSALLTHSNVPVKAGKRTSLVQYSAAGLYRYAHCGFETLSEMKRRDEEKYSEYLRGLKGRMEADLAFFQNVGKAMGIEPLEILAHPC